MEWIVAFQSPLSGQICLNDLNDGQNIQILLLQFQSPLSGQICLNINN